MPLKKRLWPLRRQEAHATRHHELRHVVQVVLGTQSLEVVGLGQWCRVWVFGLCWLFYLVTYLAPTRIALVASMDRGLCVLGEWVYFGLGQWSRIWVLGLCWLFYLVTYLAPTRIALVASMDRGLCVLGEWVYFRNGLSHRWRLHTADPDLKFSL